MATGGQGSGGAGTPPRPRLPGVGVLAVLPPGTTNFRPITGKWPAIMKHGKVYVHRMHAEANKMANGGVLGSEDAYGFVELDSTGKVIDASWQ